jgi:hypothetical protein
VNGARATLAIVRREMDATWLVDRAAGFVAGLAAGFAFDRLDSARGTAEEHMLLAGAALWFAVSGALRIDVRDGMYFTAPLYGRQLARAHALTALAGAFALPAGTLLAWALRGMLGSAFAPGGLALPLLCGVALSAVVALSATPRSGMARRVYALAAWAIGAALLVPHFLGLENSAFLALGPAVVAGFFGLRAFGETLARYDPIVETLAA